MFDPRSSILLLFCPLLAFLLYLVLVLLSFIYALAIESLTSLLFFFILISYFETPTTLLSCFVYALISESLAILLSFFILSPTFLHLTFLAFKILKQTLSNKFLHHYLISLAKFLYLFLFFSLLPNKINYKWTFDISFINFSLFVGNHI